MPPPRHILIRLPNWLGDMVMATAFVEAVIQQYPEAQIDLIVKKGLDFLLDYFPPHNRRIIFEKNSHKGLYKTWRFGTALKAQTPYDICFSLPDSLSSAIMARASGAKQTVSFKKEWQGLLLSNVYKRPGGLHRVEEYINLLSQFECRSITVPPVALIHPLLPRQERLVININSEASSRRLPAEKAISLIAAMRRQTTYEMLLVGSAKEKSFVDRVYQALPNKTNIINASATTTLPQLITLLSASSLLLTTDSGPAHVGNAVGIHTIVLFGAGNEANTGPYNKENRTIVRLGKLPCEPCTNNVCKVYGKPECLLQLNETLICDLVNNHIKPANEHGNRPERVPAGVE